MSAARRMTPDELERRLVIGSPLVVLDARRREALRKKPFGIRGAIPVLLDESPPRIPDLDRDREIVVYCLCSGQASSTRVALWLQDAGFRNVAVLEGGLPAWEAQGLPLASIVPERQTAVARWLPVAFKPSATAADSGQLVVERTLLAGQVLPVRRDMAVLFVDMVDSTSLVTSREPEEVLALVQAFMEVVVDVAVQHCGDVHDFEGDGAMLYFAGAGEAVPAAFQILDGLAQQRRRRPELPQARLALDVGPLVIGYVGTQQRRSLSFIGASVNTAARILKLAPPGGIAATERVVEHAQRTDPDLAAQFQALPGQQILKGFADSVTVYVMEPDGRAQSCQHCMTVRTV